MTPAITAEELLLIQHTAKDHRYWLAIESRCELSGDVATMSSYHEVHAIQ